MTGSGPPRAALVTVGDELLSGDRVDTNSAWMARHLGDAGFEVATHLTVRDRREEISDALTRTMGTSDLVVVTGGLGPTGDDLTREGAADALGVTLVEDPQIGEWLGERYGPGGGVSPLNLRLARRPESMAPIRNPAGSAPALLYSGDEPRHPSVLLLLPGVPAEMQALLGGEAGERLLRHFRTRLSPPATRTIRTSGIPESRLAAEVEATLPDEVGVGVAYRPSLLGVELHLTAPSGDPQGALDAAELLLAPILAPYRYDAPNGDLAQAVGDRLRERGWRVAVAESCTGGLLARRLTETPGASAYVEGGVVTYADAAKSRFLGVDPALLKQVGAVSSEVAEAMAAGVRERFGADVGVGITGIAGPEGGSREKPVGLVWFGVALPDGTWSESVIFPGNRSQIRERAAQHALLLVFRGLAGENASGREGYSSD